ncbi:hypothetical protein VN97_g12502, partial [Penicillium thymicola]
MAKTILVTAAKQVDAMETQLAWKANTNAIQPIQPNDQFNGLGTTLLGLAAAGGNKELVQILLKARAEVNNYRVQVWSLCSTSAAGS